MRLFPATEVLLLTSAMKCLPSLKILFQQDLKSMEAKLWTNRNQ